ncbi:hypothetical protein BGX26_013055 [Mortierella sp. AD094]|nr:hypothetical protein BGX26_013055 [Mortierella sp. AD094]
MHLDEFVIRNTRSEEVDTFIDILETAAEWLQANDIKQWPPGMFRNADSRAQILNAIAAQQCYMIDYHPSKTSNGKDSSVHDDAQIAGLFVINYDDSFDEILWKGFAEDWKDALYLHRLVLRKPYQGAGITTKIIEFVENRVKEAGRHYLRLDCLAGNISLRRFYREKCRGREKGGLNELSTIWNPELGLEFARFEIQVVPKLATTTTAAMCQQEFLIRNTKPEELEEYINILERAAEWMQSQRLAQWIPGTFRKPDSRLHISNAIAAQNSYVVEHLPSRTIAAIFALNYEDPFDDMLWTPLLGSDHWKDAIYVHRLVVERPFQGRGIVPMILAFAEELVPKKGKNYLRLDCRGNNPGLRKFYREKCRGMVVKADGAEAVMGLEERGTYTNPATGIEYARFERMIVPPTLS